MMKAHLTSTLERFERSIHRRSATIAASLRPGLAEAVIRDMLVAADVRGNTQPVFSFFEWKNGAHFDSRITLGETSPFPESVHGFADLQTMIEHFTMFRETFVYHPRFKEADGRYFPLFWDNSSGYLAVDLSDQKGRVVVLDPESEDLAREAYISFEDFLEDAIRANEENEGLACFQI